MVCRPPWLGEQNHRHRSRLEERASPFGWDTLNPFDKDRFRYDVLSHTDHSRDKGEVGDLDLATINWGGYDLVVIDESHNFRNNKTPTSRLGRLGTGH